MTASHTAQLIVFSAFVLDLVFGEYPDRFHPVLYMGHYIKFLWSRRPGREKRTLLLWGVFLVLSGGFIFWCGPYFLHTFIKGMAGVLVSILLLKPVFALKALVKAAGQIKKALEEGDLEDARRLTSYHLVSRDTENLSEEEVCGAVIESVSENLTDSFVSPLFYFAFAGIPGAWAYRFVNTCDSLIGYRTAEYESGGKFAARFDDILNWIPARLAGLLIVAAAAVNGEKGKNAWKTMRQSHGETSSPNAGWTMSAMAGSLGISLEKREEYTLVGGEEKADFQFIGRATRIIVTAAGMYMIFLLALLEVLV
ncbi:cobalamin biosynthesis protein [Spirochaeta isovalerica]|uniref:Cobalamin biosynthesis protein CobD n=1 Tax=Spirochaeta isovalerica TaxID=150 RepID=A0A841R5H6_9SPIO|nr:cobalamin biosynthesis protein [Spirochaeta isovalerica]MBB6479073.1 adenosylcobinamide-phosphate synthase [Spirochaeta isovalerica]